MVDLIRHIPPLLCERVCFPRAAFVLVGRVGSVDYGYFYRHRMEAANRRPPPAPPAGAAALRGAFLPRRTAQKRDVPDLYRGFQTGRSRIGALVRTPLPLIVYQRMDPENVTLPFVSCVSVSRLTALWVSLLGKTSKETDSSFLETTQALLCNDHCRSDISRNSFQRINKRRECRDDKRPSHLRFTGTE